MRALGWPDHCVHSGPVIRAEYEYKNLMLEERQHLIRRMMTFTRHLDIRYQTIILDKKNVSGPVDMTGKLSKLLARFIKDHLEYLLTFDRIKVYYDNGQVEITRILSSVFNALLDNVEFKKVIPSDYRLFQVADLICTMHLIETKLEHHSLSKSEMLFFGDERTLERNYLRVLKKKKL